ncbi:hypothetical protein A2Y68_01985 [Candidatus Woesebacteria bacterium RBG_13_46_13]|uniref:Uncharacterized protein n=1 Tax=Candidatus Woesebacteria bacterium RBG_13_46_13 TaxID=1802479 RepID=A0A1F7X778_9BACT|nr:MAG: hypothetical protein A2Y68_01985 [Candidatus Woesebacteria bacterium RBG_13_46_13]
MPPNSLGRIRAPTAARIIARRAKMRSLGKAFLGGGGVVIGGGTTGGITGGENISVGGIVGFTVGSISLTYIGLNYV